MSAPRFAPTPVIDDVRAYASPDVVPAAWSPDRPADLDAGQPSGSVLDIKVPIRGTGSLWPGVSTSVCTSVN